MSWVLRWTGGGRCLPPFTLVSSKCVEELEQLTPFSHQFGKQRARVLFSETYTLSFSRDVVSLSKLPCSLACSVRSVFMAVL